MKKLVKYAGFISLISASLFFTETEEAFAASTSCSAYGSVPAGINPSFQHVNCLVTKTALEQDIPPEVLKAVLTQETGNWKQFDASGQAIVSADGGIGLMQLTKQAQFVEAELKANIEYNLKAGAAVLDSMYDSMPKISGASRDTIESWYFPVMAYNGIKPVNSPLKKETGEVNTYAYQEQVFAKIEANSLLNDTQLASIPFLPEDFQYNPASPDNIVFKKLSYTVSEPMNQTVYKLQKGDRVIVRGNSPALRKTPNNTAEVARISEGAILTITGGFQFTENENSINQYVWYPVVTASGQAGFVSSAYLEKINMPVKTFSDIKGASKEIMTLVNKRIISGGTDGLFHPDRSITRGEAALLMLRALSLPDKGKHATVVIQEYKIMNGYLDGTFRENKPVSRGEMAIILANAFKLTASAPISFTDVPEKSKAYQSIQKLVAAKITNGYSNNTFQPNNPVLRKEFAVLLYRALYQ